MTSTPALCGTCLFRRLPHFSGRCHSKKCRAIFMFGWPQASTIKFPFSSVPGQALTGPSTARGLSGSVRCFIGLDALEGAPLVKNRPGDAGELVGERNRQHVVV